MSTILSLTSVPFKTTDDFDRWITRMDSHLERVSERDWVEVIPSLRQAEKTLIQAAKRKRFYGYAPVIESSLKWFTYFDRILKKKIEVGVRTQL